MDTESNEDQNCGGAMLYENTRRIKEYREKKHNTGEHTEWQLDAPTPHVENA